MTDIEKMLKQFGNNEPEKILLALTNGFYHKSYDDDWGDSEITFWRSKTFFLKYMSPHGWCFAKVSGGTIYNKTEENMGFTFSYEIVPLKQKWALTKEELE